MSSKKRPRPNHRTTNFFFRRQSRGHSAHIGLDVVVRYRWHPLYGRSARCVLIERRASCDIAHVEQAPGVVTMVAAWKLDPVACAGMQIGLPRVSLAALDALHELLLACESRVSADGNTATQETHDGIAGTAHAKDGPYSEAGALVPKITAPTRPRSRRHETAGHDAAGAAGCAEGHGASHARGQRPRNAGGRQ